MSVVSNPAPTMKGWETRLPKNWSALKLKHVADVRLSNVDKKSVEGERAVRLCNYVDVYYNDFIDPDMDFMNATASDAQIRRFALRKGDVLITKDSEAWDDIAVPAYVTTDFTDVVCGYHLSHLRPYKHVMDGRFLLRAIGADGIRDHFRFSANGITRYGVGLDDISSALIPTPPLPEQQDIADFLDRKTAQIDTLIAKKQRLIELVGEKRQALISHAVTKGLEPNVPMKDSGIEWLGEIPAHWAAERLKFRMTKIEQGWSPQCENWQTDAGEWGVLKVGCMNSGIYDESENKALPPTLEPVLRYEIEVGDILMSRSNTVELVGAVGRVHETQGRILLCDKLYRLDLVEDRLNADFAVHLLRSRSSRLQLERDASGASPSMKNISNERVTNMELSFPPISEQKEIVRFLNSELTRSRSVERTISLQIAKLQEYRQTLISAAVTGKIDVTKEVG